MESYRYKVSGRIKFLIVLLTLINLTINFICLNISRNGKFKWELFSQALKEYKLVQSLVNNSKLCTYYTIFTFKNKTTFFTDM